MADFLRDVVKVSPNLRGEVGPLIHLFNRHDQRVAVRNRLDGEEGDDGLVAVNKAAGNLAGNDLAEYGAHACPSYL